MTIFHFEFDIFTDFSFNYFGIIYLYRFSMIHFLRAGNITVTYFKFKVQVLKPIVS